MPKIPERRFTLYNEDCRDVMKRTAPNSVDSIVTDPPYGLKFMGQGWDHGVPGEEFWKLALEVVKPSSYMVAFGGTRTFHRLAVAIEDSGWEIRDCLMWLYGSGFPKAKSCLKPAWEPILLCRKPGPMNSLRIDDCRVPTQDDTERPSGYIALAGGRKPLIGSSGGHSEGRWPANLVHDGSEEVIDILPVNKDGFSKNSNRNGHSGNKIYGGRNADTKDVGYGGEGSVARFFYCAKANKTDRGEENKHPTVKPTELLRWLTRLITPPNGLVLDPFMGSGSTGKAALKEGLKFVGCEIDQELGYFQIAQTRIRAALLNA